MSKEYIDSYAAWVDSVKGPGQPNLIYPIAGLSAEVGEVMEILQKRLRKGETKFTDEDKDKIYDELGDVIHYCFRVANDLGCSIDDIMVYNIDKIERKRDGRTTKKEAEASQ